MTTRSWFEVEPEPPEHRLPDDLRARDAFGARDCGWVTQMRPFVRMHSQPGDVVFDPFCGFGTTLLAAGLEGRRGLGMEIDRARAALARERLQRHGVEAEVMDGTLPHERFRSRIDLCLTSVPYFGCDWGGSPRVDQLYQAPDFAMYLLAMRGIFHAVRQALPEGGMCIAMVENARLDGRVVPQAWELARILCSLFEPSEERVLLYPSRPRPPAEGVADPAMQTDRSHEYALVFRKCRPKLDIEGGRALVHALRRDGHVIEVHGSFLPWMGEGGEAGPDTGDTPASPPRLPGDIDVHADGDPLRLRALLSRLVELGFRLSLWGEPVNADVHPDTIRRHHYVRAERLLGDGRVVRLDVSLRDAGAGSP